MPKSEKSRDSRHKYITERYKIREISAQYVWFQGMAHVRREGDTDGELQAEDCYFFFTRIAECIDSLNYVCLCDS